MQRFIALTLAIIAVLSGASLMQLKLAVQDRVQVVEDLAKQIHKDRKTIRILEAEWAHLTTPEMLQDRSVRFLALMPPRAEQVVVSPVVVPMRPDGVDVQEAEEVLLPVSFQGASAAGRIKVKLPKRNREGET